MAENPIQRLLAKMQGSSAPQQLTRTDAPSADNFTGLPPTTRRNAPPPGMVRPAAPTQQLKNASVVYGLGSLLLYALSFYNLANAEWFNGLMLLLPSTCLAYLAYRYMIQAE